MPPTKSSSFDACDATTEPLQPSTGESNPPPPFMTSFSHHGDDDVSGDCDARRDDVPVLECEGGSLPVRQLQAKKAQYLKIRSLRWPKRPPCPLKGREVGVLGVGVVMTVVAVGLIVAGTVRRSGDQDDSGSDGRGPLPGSRSTFLHVSSTLKRLPSEDLKRESVTDQIFTFQELLMLNNYALNKPTHQSSVFMEILDIPELDGEADFAVDGSVSTCARTDPEHDPFWYVDMGQIEHIRSLRFYGSNYNLLHDLDVYVGNSENVTDNSLCTSVRGDARTIDVRAVCDNKLSGRYVGLVMRTQPKMPESLILCEALVYLM